MKRAVMAQVDRWSAPRMVNTEPRQSLYGLGPGVSRSRKANAGSSKGPPPALQPNPNSNSKPDPREARARELALPAPFWNDCMWPTTVRSLASHVSSHLLVGWVSVRQLIQ